MAVAHPQKISSPALHDFPTLPVFETYPSRPHNAKYITALEAEHSRDLYLQGAMAVGQIARLLEELCADIYDDGDPGEVAVDELSTRTSEAIGSHQFVSHEKRDQITAWARAVGPADDLNGDLTQACDLDIIDLEDADTTYLRGAFVVGDIADLLDDLVKGLNDEETEECEKRSAFSLEQVALAQLPAFSREIPDSDFASRLSSLSARLAKLEIDINEFSQERCNALKQMEQDDAVRDKERRRSSEVIEPVDSHVHESPADAQGISDILESEENLLTRVWTMAETATSGLSLVTPSESGVQPMNFESVKDYFWSLD